MDVIAQFGTAVIASRREAQARETACHDRGSTRLQLSSRFGLSDREPFARWLLAACLVISIVPPAAAAPIVPPGATPEKLFEGQVLTEGVAVGHDGLVYFSDITFSAVSRRADGTFPMGHIWRFDPATGKTAIYRSPSGQSNGLKFDAAGNMIAALQADFGPRCLARTDMATGKATILAGRFNGRPFNSPNDVAIDERGRIYFSDPRYLGWEPIEQRHRLGKAPRIDGPRLGST